MTIIVPYGPGGGSHQMATNIAAALGEIMGVQVNVVTMPGNNSKNGLKHYMSLPPDGYTILQHVDILASLFATQEIEIDPIKDLTPVAITQITFSQIYIRNIEPRFHDWQGFIQYAHMHPGRLRIATTGSSLSLEQVSMKLLKNSVGFEITSQAYDHPAKRYMALIEGKVDALFEQPGDVAPFLDRKLIKPILTMLPEKIDGFNDTPALQDIEVNIEPLLRFRGFFIHSRVSAQIRSYLDACFKKAYESRAFTKFNKEKYMDLIDSYRDSNGAQKIVSQTIAKYRDVLDFSN